METCVRYLIDQTEMLVVRVSQWGLSEYRFYEKVILQILLIITNYVNVLQKLICNKFRPPCILPQNLNFALITLILSEKCSVLFQRVSNL